MHSQTLQILDDLFGMARRYTFLIDPQGKIIKVYNQVETSRHSKEIIQDLKRLTMHGDKN